MAATLRFTGESPRYFAQRRVACVAARLDERGETAGSVMDFGCGTGMALPHLRGTLRAQTIWAVDFSEASLAIAQSKPEVKATGFLTPMQWPRTRTVDLIFTNGTFHHIEPDHRAEAISFLAAALRPKGFLAFWENKPLNLGTHYVMARCPFDREAQVIPHWSARRMLRAGGFECLRTEFSFIFPRLLARLRMFEPALSRVPPGGQYLILARKRDSC